MKTLFLTIAMLAIIDFNKLVTAQSPDWQWSQSAGGTDYDDGRSVCTDVNGNVFMTGEFWSYTITFGTTTLINAGQSDIFIVKYDASGNVLWAKSAGGLMYDSPWGICTDAVGNVIITGIFGSPSINFGTTSLTNSGLRNIFIAKFDTSGNVLWAKSEGGTGWDESFNVSTDSGGNVIVVGTSNSSSITFGTNTLYNSGGYDIFIVKYDSGGNVLWAQSAVGTNYDVSTDISADVAGNVFMTGYFTSPAITFGTTTLSKTGVSNSDIFIVKYNASGNVIWAKSAGGTGSDYCWGVSTDANGNIIITGDYDSPGITFGTTTLNNVGSYDAFFVKYDTSGSVVWANSAGGSGIDYSQDVSTDASGNSFMTGSFEGPSITFGTTTLTNAGSASKDIHIVKYDANGNKLWAKSAGGTGGDYGTGVCTDAIGNVFVTGGFGSTSINFGTTSLTNSGSHDVFIAKLDTTLISGITEHSDYSTIAIAPNPFTSQTTISFKEEQKNTTIRIVDILGKEIKNMNFTGKQLILEKGEMLAGIYFVQVFDAHNNRTSRWIVIQ